MGTSTPYKGPRNDNPLLPDWLPPIPPTPPADPPPEPPQGPPAPPEDREPPPPAEGEPVPVRPGEVPEPAPGSAPPPRFQAARRSFTDFAKSGGDDRKALGRALRSFVRRAGGGTGTTSRRMAAERGATVRLAGILDRAAQSPGGIREVARQLNLGALAEGSLDDLYSALADVVCPPGGDLDDAHAKDAYLEAVFEMMRQGLGDLERPSPETVLAILATFITNAVHLRVVNAIGNNIVSLPSNVHEATRIEAGMKDFIRGCVEDALREAGDTFPADDLSASIDDLYDRAISVLDARADAVAEGEEK